MLSVSLLSSRQEQEMIESILKAPRILCSSTAPG